MEPRLDVINLAVADLELTLAFYRYFRDPDGHLWEVIWNPDGVPKPRG